MKKITYQLASEVNKGTLEEPDFETVLSGVEITCLDSKLTDNLALAKAEAYQGEVSVEDAGPDPAPSGDLEQRVTAVETGKADRTEVQAVWDQMAAAYQEGVQNA